MIVEDLGSKKKLSVAPNDGGMEGKRGWSSRVVNEHKASQQRFWAVNSETGDDTACSRTSATPLPLYVADKGYIPL